jgi:hypothetical protein
MGSSAERRVSQSQNGNQQASMPQLSSITTFSDCGKQVSSPLLVNSSTFSPMFDSRGALESPGVVASAQKEVRVHFLFLMCRFVPKLKR